MSDEEISTNAESVEDTTSRAIANAFHDFHKAYDDAQEEAERNGLSGPLDIFDPEGKARIKEMWEQIDALETQIKVLREALEGYRSGTSVEKQWCDFGGAVCSKWFHGVTSGDVAKEALAKADEIARKK